MSAAPGRPKQARTAARQGEGTPAIPARQRGAAMIVALIVLILMSVFAISAFNSSSANLRIVGNMQARQEGISAAQDAIERTISSAAFTIDPAAVAASAVDLDIDGTEWDTHVYRLSRRIPALGVPHQRRGVVGVYDVYGGSPETALREAVQVPTNDPLLVIPPMAHATLRKHSTATTKISAPSRASAPGSSGPGFQRATFRLTVPPLRPGGRLPGAESGGGRGPSGQCHGWRSARWCPVG